MFYSFQPPDTSRECQEDSDCRKDPKEFCDVVYGKCVGKVNSNENLKFQMQLNHI